MKKMIFILVILFLSATPAFCDIINVPVSDDAYTDSFYPDHEHGATNIGLWVGATVDGNVGSPTYQTIGSGSTWPYWARSYLKFNLSGYSNINSATLYILKNQNSTQTWNGNFPNQGIGVGQMTMYQYIGAEDWDEATLTWNNAPKPLTEASLYTPLGTYQNVDATTQWMTWDVTSWAQAKEGNNLSLVLTSGDPFSIFYSSESGNSNWAPYLKINGTPVTPEPASMLLFGIGGLGMAFARRKKK